MKVDVVTTFDTRHWPMYASRMVRTFLENWPGASLTCYITGSPMPKGMPTDQRLRVIDFTDHQPLVEFQRRNAHSRRDKHVLNDPCRWAYKVYALDHALPHGAPQCDWLVWLDADTRTVHPVDLEELLPKSKNLVFIGRPWLKPRKSRFALAETGFVGYRVTHPRVRMLIRRIRQMWDKDECLQLDWQCDGYAFNAARHDVEVPAKLDLSKGLEHVKFDVWPYTVLGKFMRHYKGNRKHDLPGRPPYRSHKKLQGPSG